MIIVLPWPDRRLSPNARLHWRAKVGPKQAAKIAAGWATVAAKGYHSAKEALADTATPIPIEMRFYPPDKRHRDDDNMIGSMKAARDAIAEALGVDDRRFRPHYLFEEPVKPGRVEIIFPRLGDNGVVERLRPSPTSAQGDGSDASANSTSEPDQSRIGAAK